MRFNQMVMPLIRYKYRCMFTIKPRVGTPRWGAFPGKSPEKPSRSREGVPGANVSLPRWLSAPPGRDPSQEPGPGAERAPWTAQNWQGAAAMRCEGVLFLHYSDQAFNARDDGVVSGRFLCVRDFDASKRAFAVKASWGGCQAGPRPGRVPRRASGRARRRAQVADACMTGMHACSLHVPSPCSIKGEGGQRCQRIRNLPVEKNTL